MSDALWFFGFVTFSIVVYVWVWRSRQRTKHGADELEKIRERLREQARKVRPKDVPPPRK